MSGRGGKIIPFPGQPRPGALVLSIALVFRAYPVWRRLRMPDSASFWDLHAAIQDVMGWGHRHRHLFTLDSPATGERLRLGIPEPEGYYGRDDVLPSWQHQVIVFARTEHPPILYTYHLGEEWQHEVMLEAIEPAPAGGPLPSCLGGEGACPIEDLGGAEAFTRLVEGPFSERPKGFDPADFSPDEVVFCDPGLLWRDTFGRP